MKLTQDQLSLIGLIQRSPDVGDGWRQVGPNLWPLVEKTTQDRLDAFKLDGVQRRIKLTDDLITALRFM